MKTTIATVHVIWLGLILLGGCAITPPTSVHQPMSARPPSVSQPQAANGAIYQPGYSRIALFEDQHARNVGDILTITIEEKTTASKASNSSASRKGSDLYSVPTVFGLPGKSFQSGSLEANSSTKFDGSGSSGSNNLFTGNVTVTVIEVLTNGNLLVSGEKQLGINQGAEFVRFSGIVNPTTITASNAVSSTKVADARIEYKGSGYIDEAQTMGWLGRIFMSILPF